MTKISIFDQNFDFRPKFRFLLKILIFDQIFRFLTKILIFDKKLTIFDQNFDFWQKMTIFEQNFDFKPNFYFWTQFRFLSKISISAKISKNRLLPRMATANLRGIVFETLSEGDSGSNDWINTPRRGVSEPPTIEMPQSPLCSATGIRRSNTRSGRPDELVAKIFIKFRERKIACTKFLVKKGNFYGIQFMFFFLRTIFVCL